jgi:hypothetical protein
MYCSPKTLLEQKAPPDEQHFCKVIDCFCDLAKVQERRVGII